MTATGTCKFCHQIRTIEHIPENTLQAERDETATHECDCEGARKARMREERIDRAKTAIRQIVESISSVSSIISIKMALSCSVTGCWAE